MAKDLVGRIQLRHAMKRPLGGLKMEMVLRKEARGRKHRCVRAADFENIAGW